MAKYIDKSALVAELERILSAFENSDAPVDRLRASILIGLLSFINTLEVKEVDIEKKKMEWIEQLCKYFKANYLYVSGHESFISDFRMYAKKLK